MREVRMAWAQSFDLPVLLGPIEVIRTVYLKRRELPWAIQPVDYELWKKVSGMQAGKSLRIVSTRRAELMHEAERAFFDRYLRYRLQSQRVTRSPQTEAEQAFPDSKRMAELLSTKFNMSFYEMVTRSEKYVLSRAEQPSQSHGSCQSTPVRSLATPPSTPEERLTTARRIARARVQSREHQLARSARQRAQTAPADEDGVRTLDLAFMVTEEETSSNPKYKRLSVEAIMAALTVLSGGSCALADRVPSPVLMQTAEALERRQEETYQGVCELTHKYHVTEVGELCSVEESSERLLMIPPEQSGSYQEALDEAQSLPHLSVLPPSRETIQYELLETQRMLIESGAVASERCRG
jgi:hypothetical protein